MLTLLTFIAFFNIIITIVILLKMIYIYVLFFSKNKASWRTSEGVIFIALHCSCTTAHVNTVEQSEWGVAELQGRLLLNTWDTFLTRKQAETRNEGLAARQKKKDRRVKKDGGTTWVQQIWCLHKMAGAPLSSLVTAGWRTVIKVVGDEPKKRKWKTEQPEREREI